MIAKYRKGTIALRLTPRGSRYFEITVTERGKQPLRRVCDRRTKGWQAIRAAIGNPSWWAET